MQNRAQQSLAQRKSVKTPVERTVAQANTEGALARNIASITPASVGESRAMRAGSQKDARLHLVAKVLPQFPPRPKANPKREAVQVATALATLPHLPVIPNSVAEIPTLPRAVKKNPFDVSIVNKAYVAT